MTDSRQSNGLSRRIGCGLDGIIAVILAIRFWDKIRMYMQGRGWLGLRAKNQHSILFIVATLITWDQTYFFLG